MDQIMRIEIKDVRYSEDDEGRGKGGTTTLLQVGGE